MNSLAQKQVFYPLFLGALFIAAFTIPLLFVVNFFHNESSLIEFKEEEPLLFSATNIPFGGAYLQVESHKALNVTPEKDFLLWVWFRLKRFPEEGQPVVFLAKIDAEDPSRSGYTLGVAREGYDILPIVYWRDREGRGASHTFSKISILPKKWVFLAVTYTEGKYLGVHSSIVKDEALLEKAPSVLLGGYEIDPPVFPSGDSPFILGAEKNGKFRGKIGPFGIIQMKELSNNISDLISELIHEPVQLPNSIAESDVALAVFDGRTDSSSYAHKVTLFGKRKGRLQKNKNGSNK